MTGMLQDLLHERADELGTPHVDLATITRDGERRVRRRRTAVLGGIAVATLAAVAAVPALLPSEGDRTDRLVADGTSASPVPLSWTTGSVLHRAGLPDVDLGVDVRAWVWAGDSVVFTDEDRNVHVWGAGATEVIGRTALSGDRPPELVSDDGLAAWVSDEGRVVRYDTARREAVTAPPLPGDHARVTAMDGSQVYVADSAGVYAWQPTTPDAYRTLSDDPDRLVLDAEGGTTVQLDFEGWARVSGPGRDVGLTVDGFANLSPSGEQVMAESDDEGLLMDTATGQRTRLRSGHAWSLPFQWLDDTRVVVLAYDGTDGADPRAYLQDCDTITGECDGDGTEVPSDFGGFQLPIGIHLDS